MQLTLFFVALVATAATASDFVQKICKDPTCSMDCKEVREPQNTCISTHRGSYKAICATDALIVTEFAQANCSGTSRVVANAINTCSIVFGLFDEEHFIINDCSGKPPAPTSGPTTAAPPSATFTQKDCMDNRCSALCQNKTFPQNKCLQMEGGAGSITAYCTATSLEITEYPVSSDCTGFKIPQSQPINQCLQDETGSFFENLCNNGGTGISFVIPKRLKSVRRG